MPHVLFANLPCTNEQCTVCVMASSKSIIQPLCVDRMVLLQTFLRLHWDSFECLPVCAVQKRHGCASFAHRCVPSASHSAWHIVFIQQIFIDWE